MKKNRLILSVLLSLWGATTLFAARALSIPYTYTQPDGSEITLTLHGDEYASWVTMDDGIIVIQQDQGYYLAQVGEDGQLSATKWLAHHPSKRHAEEQQFCLKQQQQHPLFFKKAEELQQAGRRAQVTNKNYFPHQGSPKCLVILAEFQDVTFTSKDPKAQFEQYFNGDTQQNLGQNEDKNLCSVSRYFDACSRGQFTPQFDVVGPITLPKTQEYYGKDNGNTKDVNFSQFCRDAIAAVDDQVEFSHYDNDGDGRAELVCVIFAGYGQNAGDGNPATSLWAKCGYQGISTADKVSVNYVNCNAELFRTSKGEDINGIGVCLHEFSHGMGLPDLYATTSAAQINNQTPEYWDLMDYGEYAQNGYSPVPYTVWEQEAFGWTEAEKLTASQKGIETKSLISGGKAYKFGNGADPEEWIMVEYANVPDKINQIPGFCVIESTSFAPMSGLLVWHIAYASSTVSMGDYPNNTPNTPRVCIVPADGQVINGYLFGDGKEYSQTDYVYSLVGDPFPGTSNVTELTADMGLPNYQFYHGEAITPFTLRNIQEDTTTGTITFDFDNGVSNGILFTTADKKTSDSHYYTLDGHRLQGAPTRSGVYVHHGRLHIIN